MQEPKDSEPKKPGCSFGAPPYLSSKTIYTTIDGSESLLQAKSLREVCELEDEIVRKQPLFGNECDKSGGNFTDCCPSISIGHYIAKLSNRTGCHAIVDNDVDNFKGLIKRYVSAMKTETFTELEKAIIGNVLTFLVDKQYAKNPEKLTYTLVFSPVPTPSRNLLKGMYEKKLQKIELLKKDKVKLVAYDFQNLKTVAYDSQLIADIWYIMLAVGLILCLMWGYSGSLFISIMGFSSVVFAIILSYWLYTVVFRLSFFPFLNIMTTVFVVGIGADDIFVYVLAWRHARQKFSQQDKVNATLAQCTEYALEHATAAMFVTSFTTATAFYAGLSSSITALQCFSIFAGTSILTNYFLMITWLPAVIIAQERFFARISCGKTPVKPLAQEHPGTSALSPKELADHNNNNNRNHRNCFPFNSSDIRQMIKDCSDVVFQKWIGQIVVKLRYCWLAIFLIIAMFGLLSLTYYPRLSLPTTQQIPLFIEDHSIERYDSVIKSKLKIEDLQATRSIRFPVIFIWGAVDIDNGYFLNPSNTGKTEWDSSFSLMDEKSQERMLQFCENIRKAPFYDSELNNQSWCFIEALKDFIDSSDECKSKTVPLKPADFMECTKAYVAENKNLPIKINSDGKIEALVLTFQSNRNYEMKFSPVERFWNEVKVWTEKEIGSMPVGLKNGWVISSLYFYDLQKSIADGTIHTIIVSIAVSALVLLITTRNILITLYAVIAITAIISVTVGSLVMAGWQLNVFESMMISVAIGLSIDFTLHYGVAYFSCEQSQSRKERVHYSLWHVGSAVAMGTVTTFLAGKNQMIEWTL